MKDQWCLVISRTGIGLTRVGSLHEVLEDLKSSSPTGVAIAHEREPSVVQLKAERPNRLKIACL